MQSYFRKLLGGILIVMSSSVWAAPISTHIPGEIALDSYSDYTQSFFGSTTSLTFDVTVESTANYNFSTDLRGITTGRTLYIEVDGVEQGSILSTSETGYWKNWRYWQTVQTTIPLTEGNHKLRVILYKASRNIHSIELTKVEELPVDNNDLTPWLSELMTEADQKKLNYQMLSSLADHFYAFFTPSEEIFLDELVTLSNDFEFYFENTDGEYNLETVHATIGKNIRTRVDTVYQSALTHYNGDADRAALAKNTFLLMSYNALQNKTPHFMWSKLGIFAANDVRFGLTLAFTMKRSAQLLSFDKTKTPLAGIDIVAIAESGSAELLKGQVSVLADIGALTLMSERYSPALMGQQTWLTSDAQTGFLLQEEAENAYGWGDMTIYWQKRTEAAIAFGIHEQVYVLQDLWDTPLMHTFAKVNDWLLQNSNGDMALMRADIYVGTNKLTEFDFGLLIVAPENATDLSNAVHRVDVARNGFNTLNEWRQDSLKSEWIRFSQKNLGNGRGIYNIF